jgi:hypothetical protein
VLRRFWVEVASAFAARTTVTIDELAAFEQIRKAVRVQDDRDHVRRLGLVDLDEAHAQLGARDAQALAQPHETGALTAQVRAQALELGALGVEVALHPLLARLERRDPALQPADAAVVAGDLLSQRALGSLLAADLVAGAGDLRLQLVELLLLALAGRRHRQDSPQQKWQRDGCQEKANAHANVESSFALHSGPNRHLGLWSLASDLAKVAAGARVPCVFCREIDSGA